MKIALVATLTLFAITVGAQSTENEDAVRKIIQDEVTSWNKGDAEAYSRHFAVDGTFTNLLGMFFTGRNAFRERHEKAFDGIFRGSTKQEDIVSIKFVRPDVVIVETLQSTAGFHGLPSSANVDSKGRLRTRLLQVLVKDSDGWKIEAYHMVDVKAGTSVPEPE
jgi:uncharacterized protein (TIGR02246 family)